ncbi:MAG: hypothetical protein GX879_00050 [Bacteroidales bacterium]|nr:hypothetical protein [Bacteroidales bacterium]
MNKRKLLYWIGGGILATALIFLAFWVFGKSSKSDFSNPVMFEPYIAAYSGGVVSKNADIIVQFTESFAKEAKENIKPNKIISVSGISGTSDWVNDYTLAFKPNKPLKSGQEYHVKVNLKSVNKKIDKKFKNFSFRISTKQQNFDIEIKELITTNLDDFSEQEIVGTIMLADTEDDDKVNQLISVSLSNQNPNVQIEKLNDLTYEFRIQNIKRTANIQTLYIRYNGTAIDVDKKGKLAYILPSINDFSLIEVKIQNFPEQQVILQFSDPILSEQMLEGLVKLGRDIKGTYIVRNNLIKFIPNERLKDSYDLTVSKGIKNIKSKQFEKDYNTSIYFPLNKPQIKSVASGTILPESDAGLVLPFEAVNLKAVDVRIIKIFENNILYFLQDNSIYDTYSLNRVGKVIKEVTIDLQQSGVTDFSKWNRFTLDLNDLIKTEPGAIYNIDINFRKQHSLYPCDESEVDDNDVSDEYYWSNFTDYSYAYDYNYWEDDNPCKWTYYGHKNAISTNILASNIGLSVKKGKNDVILGIVTDLLSSNPVSNASVKVYSYQMQEIAKASTNKNGVAELLIPANEKPFFVVAESSGSKSYVTLNYANSLSLSDFNVSGTSGSSSKGFIFGERGVWRPGDSIYLSFILQDKDKLIPDGHPVVLEVNNPSGQQIYREVQSKNEHAYHTFKFKTDADAQTGYYYTKISVGNEVYTKSIPIETIKPNRLNIKIDFDKEYISGDGSVNAHITANWLHGAVAKDLKASVNISLSEASTQFKGYEEYNFEDFTKRFEFTTKTLFEGKTDEDGKINQNIKLNVGNTAPGTLYAKLTTKLFEKGGNFSIVEEGIKFHPYTNYIGYKFAGNAKNQYLKPAINQQVDIVILDKDGKKAQGNSKIELSIYKYNYSWWYDYENTKTNFASANYNNALLRESFNIANGSGSFNFITPDVSYGNYIILVEDKTTGHSASSTFYISSYSYSYSENKTKLVNLNTDKESYELGEEITLNIPSAKGRAFISIENSDKVLETYWIDTKTGITKFSFKASEEMSPNVFAYVSVFQPHSQTENDHPIRMYGVVPIMVENPKTHLYPVINMPDELKSESEFEIKISEKNSRPMAYTIAVVDEGILALTNYKTPDPWAHFYRKEALGVSTWDMYDDIIGTYGIDIERLLSIGGDEDLQKDLGELKAKRFEPMVRFEGPFYIGKGKTATHKIQVPAYVGAVRTMVIARDAEAYGSAEKTTPVTKPLMLLGTLPRVLGPQEEVVLPVSVFAMEKSIKNVNVQVQTNDLVKVDGSNAQQIHFDKEGEKYLMFKLKAGTKTGVAKIIITAQSGANIAKQEIEIDIRYPIEEQTDVISAVVEANKSSEINLEAKGISGTNNAILEIYSIPPINLEKRIKFLITYPYNCLEQKISGAFPQLYLSYLTELTESEKTTAQDHVNLILQDLVKYQHTSGGFTYWPSSYSEVNSWGTSYAGHLILEAESMGYQVQAQIKSNWLKYQKNKASKWIDEGYSSQIDQAYRLYTLALANNADKGAMNRMYQNKKICKEAKWRLAAAYQLTGQKDIAKNLINSLSTNVSKYFELGGTFGSALRDKAMILETLTLMGEKQKAFELLLTVAEELSSDKWLSTQATAYSLLAVSKYIAKEKTEGSINCEFTINGKSAIAKSSKPVVKYALAIKEGDTNMIKLKNKSNEMLYFRVINSYIPEYGYETDGSNAVRMKVQYTNLDGNAIDPTKITQGTDFIAIVQIQADQSYSQIKNLALSQLFPSGWEIINSRMFETDMGTQSYANYLDIRDDRIYTHFDLYGSAVKTFKVMLNASYAGKFYMPPVQVSAMYDNTIYARTKGQWLEIEDSY